MNSLLARDIMMAEVHSVRTDTSLTEVARLLSAHHISGVPVVDEQKRVIGMVTEADLIDEQKREIGIPRSALYGILLVPEDVLRDAYRAGSRLVAGDVMTKNVITASEKTPIRELADTLAVQHINRIPIVRDGKLVGIVCRADLVRTLAESKGA